jgi:hypothetical protein
MTTDEPQPDRRRTAAAIRARKIKARKRREDQALEVLRDAGYRVIPPATTTRETIR